MTDKKIKGWNSSYFGEAKPGSLKDVIQNITNKQNALVGDKPVVADPITPEQVANKEKFNTEAKYTVSIETNKNDKSDDGEGLDAVQPKAVKKKFANRRDKDIDNDGDVDSSDKFLHKRRKAISKAVKKDEGAMKRGDHLDTFKPKPKKEKHKPGHDEDEKGKDKNGVKVHGEQADKWEAVRAFKVSSMKDALAKVYAEKLEDDDTPEVKDTIKGLKKASQSHAKQAKSLEKQIKD